MLNVCKLWRKVWCLFLKKRYRYKFPKVRCLALQNTCLYRSEVRHNVYAFSGYL